MHQVASTIYAPQCRTPVLNFLLGEVLLCLPAPARVRIDLRRVGYKGAASVLVTLQLVHQPSCEVPEIPTAIALNGEVVSTI